jgi:glycine cleavage system H protein
MKAIDELDIPDNLRYAEDHEWALSGEETVKVGINDYAQDQLGDIVFVELPQTGDSFKKGEEFGTVESVKAVAELYMPIGGEVVGVNGALEDAPELLNKSPYGEGWLVEIRPDDPGELEALMDKNAYMEMLKGLK